MNKKVVRTLSIVIILCLGIGGKFYMDQQEEKKKQIFNAEKDIALYLVQNYKGIEQIDFQEVVYLNETGSWHMNASINNGEIFNFTIHSLVDVNKSLTISYDKLTVKKRKNASANIDNVEINYRGEIE